MGKVNSKECVKTKPMRPFSVIGTACTEISVIRVAVTIDMRVRHDQQGFKNQRSCVDHNCVVRKLRENMKEII